MRYSESVIQKNPILIPRLNFQACLMVPILGPKSELNQKFVAVIRFRDFEKNLFWYIVQKFNFAHFEYKIWIFWSKGRIKIWCDIRNQWPEKPLLRYFVRYFSVYCSQVGGKFDLPSEGGNFFTWKETRPCPSKIHFFPWKFDLTFKKKVEGTSLRNLLYGISDYSVPIV